jgi:UDP-2-acetamido-2-deoxy-ribo-hexuluronate aminotransferase
LADVKHFILDVNVIVDFWLRENSFEVTTQLLEQGEAGINRFWITASQIPTLIYVARQAFKRSGLEPETATKVVDALLQDLFGCVSILSNHGFEQVETYGKTNDFEDAQIAVAARSLGKSHVCIVTEDKTFDAMGETPCMQPTQALTWSVASDDKRSLPFIDLASQQVAIRPQIERNIEKVLRHGQYVMGPEVAELETKLAEYVGVKHCISASSGTDTLMIAMMALGIGAGDEVITTPFTFIATGEMIALLGAIPVFVDIDPQTYNIDPAKIEAAITAKTKAIMPVSLYGQCADFDAINAIADKHGLPVIEDAAQSFGATYKGKKSCNLSTIGSTSFFPSKPLGAYGDGGALFTNDDALAKAMREIRVHGQEKRYYHSRIGMNGRLDTMQAAILLAKLERFDWEVEQRSKLGARYSELINALPLPKGEGWGGGDVATEKLSIITPYIEPFNTSVYAQYTVLVKNREQVQQKLKEAGIPTAVHYPVPLHLQPAFASLGQGEGCFPISEDLSKQVMSLPMGSDLTTEQQAKVVFSLMHG